MPRRHVQQHWRAPCMIASGREGLVVRSARMITGPRSSRFVNPVWLFPLTYAVHLLEEYLALGGFLRWARRTVGVQMSEGEFGAWNAFALVLMCVGAWLVSRHARFQFLEIAIAIAVLGNAAAHLIASVLTWTYSPGLITGVLVWAPLGIVRMQHAMRVSSARGRLAGTCIGVFVIIVTFAVLAVGSKFSIALGHAVN